mgnify:CR=1 FL=1
MNNCYRIVYGKNADFYWRADMLLSSFGDKPIKREELFRLAQGFPDFQKMLSYLADEGFVEVGEWTVGITAKGSLFVGRHGYKGEARRKVVGALAGIVAALAAVCTIVAVVA